VVMEIKDHVAELESQFELVTADSERLAEEYKDTTAALKLLEEVGIRLPGYITQSQIFLMRWDEEKLNIADRMEELEGMREFYGGFLGAYDNLIIEIARRRAIQSKMEKVVEDAMAKIERFYEEDAAQRDAFKQEQGDFLPVDIWPGLMTAPVKYEVLPIDKDDGGMPEVAKSVLQRAIRRVSSRAVGQ